MRKQNRKQFGDLSQEEFISLCKREFVEDDEHCLDFFSDEALEYLYQHYTLRYPGDVFDTWRIYTEWDETQWNELLQNENFNVLRNTFIDLIPAGGISTRDLFDFTLNKIVTPDVGTSMIWLDEVSILYRQDLLREANRNYNNSKK